MFDLAAYGPKVAAILGDGWRLMDLVPGTPNHAARPLLAAFNPLTDLGRTLRDREMALACHSALWLYNDFLDESHAISQDLPTPTGSFLHAIMHRREPDAGNSNYWWRRVGDHPVFAELAEKFPEFAVGGKWNPSAFVECCEAARGQGDDEEENLREIQLTEWQMLFDHCYRNATDGT